MNAFSAFEDDGALFRRSVSGRRQELSEIRRSNGPDAGPAERRRQPRLTQRLPLSLSVFNRDGSQEAWSVNFSQDGMCAETAQQLLPGTSVQLRMAATAPMDEVPQRNEAVFPGLRTMALGEVKWCRSLGGGLPRFSIGIRYYPHY